jgi:hypothetical protein
LARFPVGADRHALDGSESGEDIEEVAFGAGVVEISDEDAAANRLECGSLPK